MYILGDDYSAQSLCIEINKKFDIQGFVRLADNKLYLAKEKNELKITDDCCFVLATTNTSKRQEFIDYFSALEIDWETQFPNIIFEKSYISPISTLGYGNILYPFSGLFGSADINSFNFLHSYASVQHGSIVNNNNILYPYACVNTNVQVGNNNILQNHSSIVENRYIRSNNIISSAECVYENMENNQVFYSGIINDNL
jgi:hypothetical protein